MTALPTAPAGSSPPATGTGAVEPGGWSDGAAWGAVDHGLVARLRTQVGERLAARRQQLSAAGRDLSADDERAYARSLIAGLLDEHAVAELDAGRVPPAADAEDALSEAVFAAAFGQGRLQPLLDNELIENIDINGCDNVWLSFADGRKIPGPPVADTDAELVDLVRLLAAYTGLSSRPFDATNHELDLPLPGGSRLSAVGWVCGRPAVSIRRHRHHRVFLADLLANGTMDEQMAAFLAAAVRLRRNIIVAGATDAGKTTLLRALLAECDPLERLVTVENSLELRLDAMPDLHADVTAREARLPNSEGQGEVTMAQLVRRSLRMNPGRICVGEVLGSEIVTMLNAMGQGSDGSLSTIHARTSADVFNRISTYAIQSAERLPVEATHMLIASAIDLVVFLRRAVLPGPDGTPVKRRWVESVREVNGIDERVQSSEVLRGEPGGRSYPGAPLADPDAWAAAGYDPDDLRWSA